MRVEDEYVRKVSSRGQVVLPEKVRDALGLRVGDLIQFIEIDAGTWAVRKMVPTGSFKRFVGAFKEIRQLSLNADEFLDEVRGALSHQGDGN